MKRKNADNEVVRLEDVSPGLLCPEYAITVAIPLCNVCVNWDGPGKCKKLGESPEEYRDIKKRDCAHAVLDERYCKRFSELYPEDTKKLLERSKPDTL